MVIIGHMTCITGHAKNPALPYIPSTLGTMVYCIQGSCKNFSIHGSSTGI